MKKIKVLYLIKSLTSGGAERQIIELIDTISNYNIEPHLVIYKKELHYSNILSNKKVKIAIIEKKSKISLDYYNKTAEYINKNKIDIIHSFMVNTNFHAKILALMTKKPLICSFRNSKYKLPWYGLELLTGWIPKISLFNSNTAKKKFSRIFPLYNTKFRAIQNSINIKSVQVSKITPKTEIIKNLKLKKTDYLILSVGRITPQKNQLCLLKAVKEIVKKDITLCPQVLFVGRICSQSYFKKLRNFTDRNNLNDHVHFLEAQKNIYSYYKACNLMVLSSIYEGFPNVVMESLVLETPVVASNVSDIHDLVEPEINGFVFQNNNHEQLAELILKAKNHKFTNFNGIKRFDSKKIIKHYISLYEEAIK